VYGGVLGYDFVYYWSRQHEAGHPSLSLNNLTPSVTIIIIVVTITWLCCITA
jgi:hypothetical protein